MAPVCVACRLSLLVLCVFELFVSLIVHNVNALLVYDRQTLLDLRFCAKDLVKLDHGGHGSLPPLLARIPAHLCLAPAPPLRRKRTRRRGKRSSRLVRLKACLAGYSSSASWTKVGAMLSLATPRRSLDPVDAWLVPVIGPDETSQPRGPC